MKRVLFGTLLALSTPLTIGAQGPTVAATAIGIPDCQGRLLVKPATYVIACADQGVVASHLTWPVWRSTYAQGAGKVDVNDCTPNCAAGHEIGFGVRIDAQGVLNCPNWRLYKTLTLTYSGSPADARPQNERLTSHCR